MRTGAPVGVAANNLLPADGQQYPLVTKDWWAIRCIPLVGTTGTTDEGFLAVSPDGTQYRFDVMVQRGYPALTKGTTGPAQGGVVVPPRVDAAPAPNVFAPNDPFSSGMTKGDPKAMQKDPAAPDEFAPNTSDAGNMPIEPAPADEADDPFGPK